MLCCGYNSNNQIQSCIYIFHKIIDHSKCPNHKDIYFCMDNNLKSHHLNRIVFLCHHIFTIKILNDILV